MVAWSPYSCLPLQRIFELISMSGDQRHGDGSGDAE
jgi:hypothetical protein